MSISETTLADNPETHATGRRNSLAAEAAGQISNIAKQLQATVMTAARKGDSFDQTERAVWNSVLQIGFQAMELFVAHQGDGDLGPEVQPENGKTLCRTEQPMATVIRSVFGTHTFDQFSVDTMETINQQLGRSAGEFLADLPEPDPGSEARLLVASADCKGVPLIRQDVEKVPAFETAKKNPGNRKMATVASVYTVDPHVRTPEEITAALFREDTGVEPDPERTRPEPQKKNTTAHFPIATEDQSGTASIISGILVGVTWIISQIALRRRVGQVLIVLMDGQESLWNAFAEILPFSQKTVPVLDILHALAYVWKAAGLFCEARGERIAFTRCRLLRILNGEVLSVVRGLRQMGTIHKLQGEDLKTLNTICGYLQHNASRMRYDEYLRRGYPIASGVIEGACRHIVKDRMERSGMRWTLEGARSMLNLRAAHQSDHWRTFLKDHIAKETIKAHPHRSLIQHYKPMIITC